MCVDEKWRRWRLRERVPAAAVPVAAQTLYDEFVKDALSPSFRHMGFIGSGGRYSIKSETCWALLGLQKSAYSDGREVRFTASLLVASHNSWQALRAASPHLPERPAPGTLYGRGIAQSRIGPLLPEGEDLWWRVYDGVELAVVADDVVSAIRAHGLPRLRDQIKLAEG